MNIARLLSRMMIFLGFVLILATCAQAPLPQNSATPTIDSAHLTAFARGYPTETPSPTPIIASAANLGPAPKDCPPGPSLQNISSNIAPAVGASPVWAVGFGGPHAIVHLAHDQFDPYGGWPKKIVWEVGPNYNHLVTLRVGDLRNDTLFKFDMTPGEQITTSPVLDPQNPGHPISVLGNDWKEWGSDLLIPAAGCYYLQASWPGGSWRITFAAGL